MKHGSAAGRAFSAPVFAAHMLCATPRLPKCVPAAAPPPPSCCSPAGGHDAAARAERQRHGGPGAAAAARACAKCAGGQVSGAAGEHTHTHTRGPQLLVPCVQAQALGRERCTAVHAPAATQAYPKWISICALTLPRYCPPPALSYPHRDLEERRIYVHVFKHLRRQQAKLDKDPAKQVRAWGGWAPAGQRQRRAIGPHAGARWRPCLQPWHDWPCYGTPLARPHHGARLPAPCPPSSTARRASAPPSASRRWQRPSPRAPPA